MKIQNRGARFALTCLVLIWGVAMGSPAWPAPPSNKPGGGPHGQAGGGQAPAGDTAAPSGNSVSGEAFGVSVNTSVSGLAGVTVPKTPDVILPSNGGMVSETAVAVTVTGTLESKTLTVITTGAIGESKASAQSSATVEAVNVLNGLVTADLVVSMSSSSADGSRATSEKVWTCPLGHSTVRRTTRALGPSPKRSSFECWERNPEPACTMGSQH